MGERARTIGSEAERKAWKFLDALGYRIIETNNEEYDIDCLAEFPPRITKYGLLKPCYAPDGLTAFEVTEEVLSREKVKEKVKKFKKKIRKYNSDYSESPINGGVLLIDQKIPLNIIRFMEKRQIWVWERSRAKLYREKIRTFLTWKTLYKSPTELPIDKCASYLRCSTPPPTGSDKLLYFAVFFDDVFHKLTTKRVKEVMGKLRAESISPIMDCGVKPIHAYFTFYSIGGLSEYLREELWKSVIEPWKAEEIIIFTETEPFNDYRTLPTLTVE